MNASGKINMPGYLRLAAIGLAASVLAACGGGASTERLPPNNLPPPASYTGPPPQTVDIQNFMGAFWVNVRNGGVAQCAGCHGTTQSPLFARDDDVNLAWAAADPLVNRDDPGASLIVQTIAGGHSCWLGTNGAAIQACAATLQNWVENWLDGTSEGGTKQIQLVAPPIRDVGASRNFPADPAGFATTVYPVVREYCADCHSGSSALRQQPYFADDDVVTAYTAVKTKLNLDSPETSRLVLRLRDEFHNCWSDCSANANEMEDAIRAFAQLIPVAEVDPDLVISKALTLYDGTVASGGSRYEGSQIAQWEFKEGGGTTAFDTSGVQPAINLTLSGDIGWVGGWGIDIRSGKAQATTTSSRKLRDLITATGQYSIEAWVAPANVNQEDTRIVTYSAGPAARNFTLGQTLYSYDFYNRSSASDGNGAPVLTTADADQDAQATLQHVVVTFDPVGRRTVYVNGIDTQDNDGVPGGNLSDWDDTFAFVLGNEPSSDRQWQGVIRMAAMHNRALTPEQVQQNYDAGVGEKFFLLFNVGSHIDNGDGSYVLFEVSQFDSYSYLFTRPTFVNLDGDWTPSSPIPVKGLRIGSNGVVFPISQAFANLDTSVSVANGYAPATGQVLSSLGTVIPLEKGPDQDEFFLSFEIFGNNSNVITEPAPLTPPPPPDGAPVSDIGVKTFDEINASMAAITGVSPNQPAVKTTYATVRQQLPAVEQITAVLASHQVGIAQLAIEYCNALVEDNALRSALWPAFNFDAPAGTAFDNGTKRDQIFVPLLTRAMNTSLDSQPDEAAVRMELDNLTADLTACGGSCPANRTRTVVKAVCATVLGSAVNLVQ